MEKKVKKLKKESTDRNQIEKALKESSEKIKFFAHSISHDLKSPAIGLYGNRFVRPYQINGWGPKSGNFALDIQK